MKLECHLKPYQVTGPISLANCNYLRLVHVLVQVLMWCSANSQLSIWQIIINVQNRLIIIHNIVWLVVLCMIFKVCIQNLYISLLMQVLFPPCSDFVRKQTIHFHFTSLKIKFLKFVLFVLLLEKDIISASAKLVIQRHPRHRRL